MEAEQNNESMWLTENINGNVASDILYFHTFANTVNGNISNTLIDTLTIFH